MLAFAGIDIGGSRNTFISVLIEDNGSLVFRRLRQSGNVYEIASCLGAYDVVSCAIDAPLSYNLLSNTGDRDSDVKLRKILKDRRFPPEVVMPLNSMMAVPLRGRVIAEILRNFVGAVIETHPTASLYLIGIDKDFVRNYKKGKVDFEEFGELLKRKLEEYSGVKIVFDDPLRSDGDVDSLMCAFTSYLYISGYERLLRLTCFNPWERGFAPFYVIRVEV